MKVVLKSVVCLLAALMLTTSCSVDDLLGEAFGGQKETWTITNKNKGTLSAEEEYAAYACRFEAKGQSNVESIEFLPDGTCLITFADAEGSKAAAKSPMKRRSLTRSYYDGEEFDEEELLRGKVKMCRYSYDNGLYHIINDLYSDYNDPNDAKYDFANWRVQGNTLTIYYNSGVQETVALDKVETETPDELTTRLCRTWELQQVIVKLYNGDKLLASECMDQYDMEQDCVSDIVFSLNGTFLRHDEGQVDGVGTWRWTNLTEQELTYAFNPPYVGTNATTIYFADDYLYLTEEIDFSDPKYSDYADFEDLDEQIKDFKPRMVFLNKLAAKTRK